MPTTRSSTPNRAVLRGRLISGAASASVPDDLPTRSRTSLSARPARPVGSTRRDRRRKSRGQSMAEFAMTVPMALLMVLFGLDFGRVFLGWVALNNAAREAANYAAMNPTAWTSPFNFAVQAEYARLVNTEAQGINCVVESPVPDPSFPSGTSLGAPASVELTCDFELITPFIGLFTGNPIPVSASSAFPVRAGLIEGVPIETIVPTPTPAPTGTPAPTETPGPTPTVDPSASVGPSSAPTPTPSPTATPAPTPATCSVVSLLNVRTNRAQPTWRDAGFTGSVIFIPLVPPNYRIAWQNLVVGTTIPCTSGITVRSNTP